MLYLFGWIVLRPFFWLILRPKVRGRRNMRCKGKVIYVCNHFSMADPIAVGVVCPRIIHFMAKAELFKSKLSRFFYRILLVFPVNPSSPDLRSIKKALKLLDKGKAFGIFPEGHRSALGDEMDRMQRGAAYIALKSGAPIVPIYLDPSTWVRTRVKMSVGEKIYPDEVKAQCGEEKPVDAITARITEALMTLRAEVESM